MDKDKLLGMGIKMLSKSKKFQKARLEKIQSEKRCKIDTSATGVTFKDREKNIAKIIKKHGEMGDETSIEFEKDSDNPEYPDAVKISIHGLPVGYLKSKDKMRVLKALDKEPTIVWRLGEPEKNLSRDEADFIKETDSFNGYFVSVKFY